MNYHFLLAEVMEKRLPDSRVSRTISGWTGLQLAMTSPGCMALRCSPLFLWYSLRKEDLWRLVIWRDWRLWFPVISIACASTAELSK